MACEHEWRCWPYSDDYLCHRCNYSVIGGVHYPLGNPNWMSPLPKSVEIEANGIRYVVPEGAADALRAALADKRS